jgi:hypothetical protein
VRLALALVTIGGIALADSPAAPPVTWADWVGDWTGKLRWSNCTIDGAAKATFAIDATDGAMKIDLANAGVALGAMSLADGDDGWAAQQGDVSVHVARGDQRRDGLEIAVELESGCTMRATVRRASVGIAACDRLAAWARVEGRCTKLAKPPLEQAARLARQRETWAKASGDDRARIAAQCEARAAKVETELVDAGCAPSPDPQIGMRGPECQRLLTAASVAAQCRVLTPNTRATILRLAQQLASGTQAASASERSIAEDKCAAYREWVDDLIRNDHYCP